VAQHRPTWESQVGDPRTAFFSGTCTPKVARKAPKLRAGYHVFLRERLRALDMNGSLVAMEWKAVSPIVKEQYSRRAAELNMSAIAPKRQRFPNAMNLYVKANFAQVPAKNQIERMRNVTAQWSALSSEEKAVWVRKAAELRVGRSHLIQKRPKVLNGYHVFLRERGVASMPVSAQARRDTTADWKAAGPKVKQQYTQRAVEINMSVGAPPILKGLPNTIRLFVKENMAAAPAGSPQERMRHVVLQWKSLPSDEKVKWSRRAAELRKECIEGFRSSTSDVKWRSQLEQRFLHAFANWPRFFVSSFF